MDWLVKQMAEGKTLRESPKDDTLSSNECPNRHSFKVDIHAVLSDTLRNAEYVPKGTTTEKGGEVSPDCVRSMFNKLTHTTDREARAPAAAGT